MKGVLFAVLVVIMILVILTAEKIQTCTGATAHDEHLTSGDCALNSTITLPYVPLSRYDLFRDQDSAYFADIASPGGAPSDLDARHAFLAKACDETPGCVAFTTSGALKSGVLPLQARQTTYHPAYVSTDANLAQTQVAAHNDYGAMCDDRTKSCGLFVRKCTIPEPLYADLYIGGAYDTRYGRYLIPPGNYPDIRNIPNAIDVRHSGPILNDAISSAIIPRGLKATFYLNTNFGGTSVVVRAGEYPDLKTVKSGGKMFNDAISSLKIEYDTGNS